MVSVVASKTTRSDLTQMNRNTTCCPTWSKNSLPFLSHKKIHWRMVWEKVITVLVDYNLKEERKRERPEMCDWRAREIGLSSQPRLSLVIEEEEAGNLTRLAFRSDPDWIFACHSCRWGAEVEGRWNLRETQVRRRNRERRKGKAWGFFRNDLSEFIKLEIWVPWFWFAVEIGSCCWFWLPEGENDVRRGFAITHFCLIPSQHYYHYYH